MTRASFDIIMVTDLFIILIDLDEGRSITNDVKFVISALEENLENGIDNRVIYYRDSSGRFDQIKVSNGSFKNFFPCSDSQQQYLSELISEGG